ncbi:NAD(P)/FAD-dependent oxidoreductase [soil metagenome]
MTDAKPIDCLVIGGGPAGLTAAIYLGRFRRSVTVIDKGWSRAEWITLSHNLPGFRLGVSGPAWLEDARTQARQNGAELQSGVVDTIEIDAGGGFRAQTASGIIMAATVLLATGVIEIKPPLHHVADAVKRGVIRTCPICDGYESIGKSVAVLGTGDHAAAEALFLRTYTDHLTLLLGLDDASVLSSDKRSALQAAGIVVRHVTVGAVSLQETGLTAITVEDGETHHFDKVYSAFGTVSQSQLARSLNAQVDASDRLFVGDHQETSISGLYAAGDLVRGLNQICVASGEAAIAATAIHNRLPKPFA